MKDYQASIKTPFAHLGLCFVDNRLAAVDFIDADTEIAPRNQAAIRVCRWIEQYLEDPTADVDVVGQCSNEGTPFQKKVWDELRKIPPGEVVTYGELAKKLGTSARAVGNACRNNPVPLVVPCHRVVSANGIGGFAGNTQGDWIRIKSWLLQHEGANALNPHRASGDAKD